MKDISKLEALINKSWVVISPSWPLKNLIAVNPLSGLEDLKFKDALRMSKLYFQQDKIPPALLDVNREMIKWLQVFFDEGQATIKMPLKSSGLWSSLSELIKYDGNITSKENHLLTDLLNTDSAIQVIDKILEKLNIEIPDYELYLTLMLTTLPGWASYIKYKSDWQDEPSNLKIDFLAVRLVISYVLYPKSKELIDIFNITMEKSDSQIEYNNILNLEKKIDDNILKQIALDNTPLDKDQEYDAQLVFCIDVRSEPFRTAIEKEGNYQTFGYVGFFGLPIKIIDNHLAENYNSCPVLLSAKHDIHLQSKSKIKQGRYAIYQLMVRIYQALKYNMVTTFTLVEAIGIIYGLKLLLRSILPSVFYKLTDFIKVRKDTYKMDDSILSGISEDDQCQYAYNCLTMIGLVKNFSPLVILSGHGSKTKNNTFATSLDCGACGGRQGGINAQILAMIMNKPKVREFLASKNIIIPYTTYFIGALHNTTTDEVTYYDVENIPKSLLNIFAELKKSLANASAQNFLYREKKLDIQSRTQEIARSKDWSQVRPEWGLSKNAGLIIANRDFSKNIELDGRFFLHSYDWKIDDDNKILENILMAPMIVAQWINAQYLFSTIDNKNFGAGSKITSNIVGKISTMQGNSSDLMHGLPLQSVNQNDIMAYHEPVRLLVILHAPRKNILSIIMRFDILKKLLSNGWVRMVCFDPLDNKNKYILNNELLWEMEN